ncbi:DnaJ domain-containing protein [Microbacterium horticulturae]|uniref:DnaJ domain-containing protein n=1 Tax=Microbacterium horticulturae TaxID=3028316 RepID=A0ABY8BXU1_9MICO|nr:DnaJ domain-containing protein [Microbacterium sp. KACC 23027]WEG08327.1 DnaJ domain-containing protein [Microbacterium sp. KACC 23027]
MFDSPLSASAYEVLGVEPTADDDVLRKAYRLRLRQTHPDTGGDAALFIQVQRAWELIGTADARAAYDRGHGFGGQASAAADWGGWRAPAARTDTRPRARSSGQPGGRRREQFLTLIREWAGRGVDLPDPYDPALVRTAPVEIRRLLADALAEEATARIVADLGMGYTVWHDVAAGRHPDEKVDHIVLAPSGLYGVLSEDLGGPVRTRRGELVGDTVAGTPIADLIAGVRTIARAARVRFGGAIVVLPDDDVVQPVEQLGKVRGVRTALVARSSLANVLRQGIPGAPEIGGNEIFDVRTRLNQTLRFA